MNGQKVDALPRALQHRAVPPQVVVADGNHLNRPIHGAHRRDIAVEAARIRGRVGVPAHPVAENLVADLPVLHRVRLGMTVARARGAVARRRRRVAVLDPGGGFLRRGAASLHVDGDRRLGAGSAGKADELVGAEVARLDLVLPGEIDPRRPLVARTDCPLPVIVLRHVAARPADERRRQRRHLLHDVGARRLASIPRHQRDVVDPDRARSGEQNREPRERVVGGRPEHELVFLPLARLRASSFPPLPRLRHGLAGARRR